MIVSLSLANSENPEPCQRHLLAEGCCSIICRVDSRASWVDQIGQNTEYEWARIGPHRIETWLTSDVPCQIAMGEKGCRPVIYLAVGRNGTAHYWQWASVDLKTNEPLPREAALTEMWLIINMSVQQTLSEVVPELRGWESVAI